jgi:hypothetical protein
MITCRYFFSNFAFIINRTHVGMECAGGEFPIGRELKV